MADLEQAAVWHRQIAALVTAADRAGVAPDELPAVRARLAAQVGEFTRAASMAGAPLPALQPTAAEIAAVMPALGDLSAAASGQLLRTASATLDAADAALRAKASEGSPSSEVARFGEGTTTTAPAQRSPGDASLALATVGAPTTDAGALAIKAGAPTTPAERQPTGIETWRAGQRNSLVYGACALVVLVLQAVLFYSVNNAALAAPLCVLVFPAFAWAAGWALVGVLFEPAAGNRLDRTPKLGAFLCFAPSVLLLAAFVILVIRGIFSF